VSAAPGAVTFRRAGAACPEGKRSICGLRAVGIQILARMTTLHGDGGGLIAARLLHRSRHSP
jgi:hypothetical protein